LGIHGACGVFKDDHIGAATVRAMVLRATISVARLASLQLPLAQPHPGAAAVFVDKLHAGGCDSTQSGELTTRRSFIGGSDARIIMGSDEGALLRLWKEKRGEVEPEDLSGNLIVQLGVATEELNRRWYEANILRGSRGREVYGAAAA
jgi:hypothetical protein